MLASLSFRVLRRTCQVICEDEEEIRSLGLKLRSGTHDEIRATGEYRSLLRCQCCERPKDLQLHDGTSRLFNGDILCHYLTQCPALSRKPPIEGGLDLRIIIPTAQSIPGIPRVILSLSLACCRNPRRLVGSERGGSKHGRMWVSLGHASSPQAILLRARDFPMVQARRLASTLSGFCSRALVHRWCTPDVKKRYGPSWLYLHEL